MLSWEEPDESIGIISGGDGGVACCWLSGEELDDTIGISAGGDGGVGKGALAVGSDASG